MQIAEPNNIIYYITLYSLAEPKASKYKILISQPKIRNRVVNSRGEKASTSRPDCCLDALWTASELHTKLDQDLPGLSK